MTAPIAEIEGARPEGDGEPYAVLIVDDETAILESLELTLGDEYRVFTANTGAGGLEILQREEIALVIADQVMPGMTGVEFLARAGELRPGAVRMMLTGYADLPALVKAINEGRIYRYIPKPWEPDELRLNVKRALEAYDLSWKNQKLAAALIEAHEKMRAENTYLRREVERRYAFEGLIGDSPAMQRVFDVTEKVAQTDATVLITGETGTGKDLIARAIHYAGPRKEQRFVAQNCGALPDTLLESELFGHKRGAFTGAHADKQGLFEIADGGTIFLDEIGETEPGMQVRLLRVLQDGEIRPLGSSDSKNVDVRIVAATNRELRQAVADGRFREDLYYRLRVVEIELPPLRERTEDIPALAHHFLDRASSRMARKLSGFTNAAMDRIVDAPWHGNVRELENEVERVAALAPADADRVTVEMLSGRLRGTPGDAAPRSGQGGTEVAAALAGGAIENWDMNAAVDDLKRLMIAEAIRSTGSKTRAAEKLGIPRQSLQKMMKRLDLADPLNEGPGEEAAG